MKHIIATLLVPLALLAGDWTTVGGNSLRNGFSDEPGPSTGLVAWEVAALPSTIAMQVYTWDTRLVTMRYNFSAAQAELVCHDLATGESLWSFLPWPGAKMLPIGFRDGRVFARNFRESQRDTIYCLDAADGRVLWQSPWTAGLGIIWSAAFTVNGDPIVAGGSFPVMCLNRETGDTVWTCRRPIPNTGAECLCVFENKVFGWYSPGINRPKRLCAIDAATGALLDTSDGLPGDGDQEIPFSLGHDGTIYCARDGGLFYAIRHTDSGFVTLWTRDDLRPATYSNFGCGPDSSLYVPSGTRIYRLNPDTGALLDSSDVLATAGINARISIARAGDIYACVTTGTGEGHLYAFNSDLSELWHEDIPYFYYSGPAFGRDGRMVIAGPGTLLRAYQAPTAVGSLFPEIATGPALHIRPNPFRMRTTITLAGANGAGISIFDAAGRCVRKLSLNRDRLDWYGSDDQDRRLPPGVYLLRARLDRRVLSSRVVIE